MPGEEVVDGLGVVLGDEVAFVVVAVEIVELFGLGGGFEEFLAVCVRDKSVVWRVDVEDGGGNFRDFVDGIEFVFEEEGGGEDGELAVGHIGYGGEGAFEDNGGGVYFGGELGGGASAEGSSEEDDFVFGDLSIFGEVFPLGADVGVASFF